MTWKYTLLLYNKNVLRQAQNMHTENKFNKQNRMPKKETQYDYIKILKRIATGCLNKKRVSSITGDIMHKMTDKQDYGKHWPHVFEIDRDRMHIIEYDWSISKITSKYISNIPVVTRYDYILSNGHVFSMVILQ